MQHPINRTIQQYPHHVRSCHLPPIFGSKDQSIAGERYRLLLINSTCTKRPRRAAYSPATTNIWTKTDAPVPIVWYSIPFVKTGGKCTLLGCAANDDALLITLFASVNEKRWKNSEHRFISIEIGGIEGIIISWTENSFTFELHCWR